MQIEDHCVLACPELARCNEAYYAPLGLPPTYKARARLTSWLAPSLHHWTTQLLCRPAARDSHRPVDPSLKPFCSVRPGFLPSSLPSLLPSSRTSSPVFSHLCTYTHLPSHFLLPVNISSTISSTISSSIFWLFSGVFVPGLVAGPYLHLFFFLMFFSTSLDLCILPLLSSSSCSSIYLLSLYIPPSILPFILLFLAIQEGIYARASGGP